MLSKGLTFLLTLSTSTLAAPTAAAKADFQPPAPYDYISLIAADKLAPDTSNAALSKRNVGGVRMSDGANFAGHVWYGIYPLNTCIDLRGRCNGNDEFADLLHNSTQIGNLGQYFWIGNVSSYICLEA